MTKENLTKAAQTTDLLVSDLQQALKTATPIEGLLVLDAIEAAVKLKTRLEAIAAAAIGA